MSRVIAWVNGVPYLLPPETLPSTVAINELRDAHGLGPLVDTDDVEIIEFVTTNLSYSGQAAAAELPYEKRLESLLHHCSLHSGYPKCGYQQMTTEQKQLFDQVIERWRAENT